MNIPIIFFHLGNPEFLQHSLSQANRTNPASDIILLGDESNKGYSFVNHHNFNDYLDQESEKFVKFYSHLSTNNEQFELICFLRWFAIKNFVDKHSIDKFFYSDSDVLIYCDISKEQEKFQDYRYTLTHNISAGISFINDTTILQEYCKLITDAYSGEDLFNFDKARNHYLLLQKHGRAGGVCDMTFWEILRNKGNPGLVGETSAILEGSTFDHNINGDDGYEMKEGVKKVVWENNTPYCIQVSTGRKIKFNCLHFQGAHRKPIIKDYFLAGDV